MTTATERRVHCAKCRIEKDASLEQVQRHGLALIRCPQCGKQMCWGELPPPPPDRNRLNGLEQALAKAQEALGKVDSWAVIREREAQIRELQKILDTAAAVPGVDVDALADDPGKELARHRAEVQAARQTQEETGETIRLLQGELEPLRQAARFHDEQKLRERLQEPLPGDRESRRVATELAKYGKDRVTEIAERQAECQRLSVAFPGYRGLSAQVAMFLDGLPVVREGKGARA